MTPRVDVIVPCYNYGNLLEACVDSVLSQYGVEVRVLVMDDASSDTTEAVGRRLAARDARVEYRRHDVNRGHIATYNEALAEVTGEYCLILSADDVLTPGSLARATQVMEDHPTVSLAYGADIPFRGAPPLGTARTTCGGYRLLGYAEFLDRSCRLGHTGIQAPTAVARTSVHRTIGGYLPELPHSGDTEVWLRLAAHGDVAELDADQAFRRLHAQNMSLGYSPLRRLEEQKRAFDVHFREYEGVRPEIAALEPVLDRSIAESAFWSATRAFEDSGDERACDAYLAFAAKLCPAIEQAKAWRRFQWKRRVGVAIWRRLAPLAAGARRLAMGARL
jgi:glycosyltransferase involved in cell wall biosynthesis